MFVQLHILLRRYKVEKTDNEAITMLEFTSTI